MITVYEVSMCPARRTVNVKSICPASVNHVSYRVRSRGFSLAGRLLQAAQIATQTFLDSRHNPTALASPVDIVQTSGCMMALVCLVATFNQSVLLRYTLAQTNYLT